MSNTNELLNRINSSYAKLSKGQKRLSAYITDNYDKAAFWTAEKLGEEVGVSESTVVRFAIPAGLQGLPGVSESTGRAGAHEAEHRPAGGGGLRADAGEPGAVQRAPGGYGEDPDDTGYHR